MPWNKIPLLDSFLLPLPQMKFKSHESEKKKKILQAAAAQPQFSQRECLKRGS